MDNEVDNQPNEPNGQNLTNDKFYGDDGPKLNPDAQSSPITVMFLRRELDSKDKHYQEVKRITDSLRSKEQECAVQKEQIKNLSSFNVIKSIAIAIGTTILCMINLLSGVPFWIFLIIGLILLIFSFILELYNPFEKK